MLARTDWRLPMVVVQFLRLVGIALGSLVAAALVLGIVGSFLPLPMAQYSSILTLVLGGLIYVDIRRRDRTVR